MRRDVRGATRPTMTSPRFPDAAAFLRTPPLFAEASEAGLGRLAQAARPLTLPPGRVLFERGDAPDAAYVVVSGRLSVGVREPDGREVHFAELGPGAVLGEAAVIDGGPRTATVTALGTARLFRLPGPSLLSVLGDEPRLALALLRDVVAKLRRADDQIEERSAMPLAERLARFLLASEDPLRMTQAQLAERMGVSREAVNRQLAALAREGTVALGRGQVTILRPAALEDALV